MELLSMMTASNMWVKLLDRTGHQFWKRCCWKCYLVVSWQGTPNAEFVKMSSAAIFILRITMIIAALLQCCDVAFGHSWEELQQMCLCERPLWQKLKQRRAVNLWPRRWYMWHSKLIFTLIYAGWCQVYLYETATKDCLGRCGYWEDFWRCKVRVWFEAIQKTRGYNLCRASTLWNRRPLGRRVAGFN